MCYLGMCAIIYIIYSLLISVLYSDLSGNQLKHDKHYLGHRSSNYYKESTEHLVLINGITAASVRKVT